MSLMTILSKYVFDRTCMCSESHEYPLTSINKCEHMYIFYRTILNILVESCWIGRMCAFSYSQSVYLPTDRHGLWRYNSYHVFSLHVFFPTVSFIHLECIHGRTYISSKAFQRVSMSIQPRTSLRKFLEMGILEQQLERS